MMTIGPGFRQLRFVASAACLAMMMTAAGVGAVEVPLVDGTHWIKSSEDVKKAYLVGLANMVQVEAAYNADNPPAVENGFSPRVARGMKNQTLGSVLEALDQWYAAHPDRLLRPVVETIWFEMVVPALPKTK
ncbi:MAG: hypothetical protein V5B39_12975 [Accumulibacter sp.]|jgi:hypothetical protein|uniref:hypothetical protein n=1 Tax=Accumulibacter sp. TaxID=2053492 RepID=UPI002FC37316